MGVGEYMGEIRKLKVQILMTSVASKSYCNSIVWSLFQMCWFSVLCLTWIQGPQVGVAAVHYTFKSSVSTTYLWAKTTVILWMLICVLWMLNGKAGFYSGKNEVFLLTLVLSWSWTRKFQESARCGRPVEKVLAKMPWK